MSNLLYSLLFTAFGFFSGSILFCRRIPLWARGIDICALSPDHNPGAANVFVHCGVPMGILCTLLDLFKGALPVFLASLVLDGNSFSYLPVLLAPALGHALAPFDGGRGGKCIVVIFGILMGTSHLTYTGWFLVALYILFFAVIRLRPHRTCSIVVYGLFSLAAPLTLFLLGQFALGVGYWCLAALALYRHLRIRE